MNLSAIINKCIEANVVAFLVMVGIIWYACVKLHVGNLFEKGRQKIKDVVDKSEVTKQNSISDLNNMQHEMDILPEKIDNLKQEAKNTAETLAKNIENDTESKIQMLKDNAQTSLEYQIKNVREKLSSSVSSAAVDIAKDNFQKLLQANPDVHYKILNECIEKL